MFNLYCEWFHSCGVPIFKVFVVDTLVSMNSGTNDMQFTVCLTKKEL